MGRSLPQEWIDGTLHTLNVVRDLGGQREHPPHLSIDRPSETQREQQKDQEPPVALPAGESR